MNIKMLLDISYSCLLAQKYTLLNDYFTSQTQAHVVYLPVSFRLVVSFEVRLMFTSFYAVTVLIAEHLWCIQVGLH